MNLRRRLELAYYRAKGYFPGHIGGKPYRLVPDDRKFWRKVANNQWEPHTFNILGQCLHADAVYLDVGAWIGPTVLFAAARCHTVYCVEPDPVAYEHLLANLRLNDIRNVKTFHGALDSENTRLTISNEQGFGNSETRVQRASAGDSTTVLAMDISRFIECWNIRQIDLIKIDVEGAEFDLMQSIIDLLPSMKPCIYLSLHAPLVAQTERQGKLAAVVELARHYTCCYDKDLKKIEPGEILTPRFTDRFSEVLLTDTAVH